MTNRSVVGAQWGDEGKGKIVDLLARDADVIVRYAGGNNAGHTLVVDGRRLVVHLVPSGVVHAGKVGVLGPGVVIDPDGLLAEIADLRQAGLSIGPETLRIARRAHLVMPYHKALDGLRERGAGALGTTRRGIGPAYEDKAARRGLRVGDLEHPQRFRERLEAALASANAQLEAAGEATFDARELADDVLARTQPLLAHLEDVPTFLHLAATQGKRLLFEGAQGVLLDLDHGTFPFVTSSTTLSGGACAGAGVGPRMLGNVCGVTKAYVTRVGAGPFPTELDDELGGQLRQAGAEFGATTGRPRRCGWLDLPALRHAVRVGGIDELALTKADVLSALPLVRVCVGYRLDGATLDVPPPDSEELGRVEPIVETVEGWGALPADAPQKGYDALPPALRDYVALIERETGVPVSIVSVGPGRDQTIVRS